MKGLKPQTEDKLEHKEKSRADVVSLRAGHHFSPEARAEHRSKYSLLIYTPSGSVFTAASLNTFRSFETTQSPRSHDLLNRTIMMRRTDIENLQKPSNNRLNALRHLGSRSPIRRLAFWPQVFGCELFRPVAVRAAAKRFRCANAEAA